MHQRSYNIHSVYNGREREAEIIDRERERERERKRERETALILICARGHYQSSRRCVNPESHANVAN